MELFVKKSEKISVDIWAWEVDGNLQASPDEKDAPPDIEPEPKRLKFVFRKPSYRDSNYILGAAEIKSENDVNPIAFNDAVIRTLLLEMHDGDEVYQMTAQRLSELNPVLTRAAIAGIMGKIAI
jgi:hypothetical protein